MTSTNDILSLIDKGKSLRAFYFEQEVRKGDKFLLHEKVGIQKGSLHEFLSELYYDMDILLGPDGPFPVATIDLSPSAVDEPENLLGSLPTTRPPKTKILKRQIIDALQKRGAELWNGSTFSLDSVSLDKSGRVKTIDAYLGRYFDTVSSAHYLEWEILAALDRSQDLIRLSDLPAREKALSNYDTPSECLLAGGGVDSAISISTLVVYLREDDEDRYWLLCDARSKAVAVHHDLYHVLPSFMFQPVTATSNHNLGVEWSVIHNIYREYLEELFNVREIKHAGRHVAPDYFYQHPNLRLLRNLLSDGSAEIRGVTLAFNLLNHRPEICTLLLIKDKFWYESQKDMYGAKEKGLSHLELNDEFLKDESRDNQTDLEVIVTLPLDDDRWSGIAKPWLMVPPGAASLIHGAKAAVSLLDLPEPQWLQNINTQKA
jgi:hypothetical protein